jgi:hypothetical protein
MTPNERQNLLARITDVMAAHLELTGCKLDERDVEAWLRFVREIGRLE